MNRVSNHRVTLPGVLGPVICGMLLALLPLTVLGQEGGLQWRAGAGFRSAALQVPSGGKPGFTRLNPSDTGILFTNWLAQSRHLTNQILLNGSGAAAGDVDGDGWCDLYFCGLDGRNALYRNLGNWRFEDITARAGLECEGMDSTGAVLVDFDGDSDLDLLLNSVGHGTHIFINLGGGRFQRATGPQGLNAGRGGMSLAVGDMDGDTFLDFYITNYRVQGLMDLPETDFWLKNVGGRQVVAKINGQPVTPELMQRFRVNERGGITENGEEDILYRNLGGTNVFSVRFTEGAFSDEAGQPIRTPLLDWGLSAMFRDINGDGRPDLYVCNDFDTLDRVWINQGGGRFRQIDPLAMRKNCIFSMGIDFADINRDGFDDFLVLDMLSRSHAERMDTQPDGNPTRPVIGRFDDRPAYLMNTLFLNRGDGTYAEVAQYAGVEASGWSWTAIFLDVDLDGWEDLLISNGHEREGRSMDIAMRLREQRIRLKLTPAEILQAREIYPRLATANMAFRNRRDLTFESVGDQWGFAEKTVSHGMALADLDNDGDMDLVVNNLNDPAGIFRNNSSAPRLAVRLKGAGANTRGIGARILVRGPDLVQSQEMLCGGRYLSSDQPQRTFAALGSQTIEVRWPRGGRSVITGAEPDRIYEVEESGAVAGTDEVEVEAGEDTGPFFEDVSARIGHRHVEEPFDDGERQALMPRLLSQLGPGVAWVDLDGDSWEDLVIGSGRGGTLGVYRNDHQGGFVALTGSPWDRVADRDYSGLVEMPVGEGGTVLLVGASDYEAAAGGGGSVLEYRFGNSEVMGGFGGLNGSAGPLAAADVDGDGDLDLFVGGRVIGGRYPEAAGSMIWRTEGGGRVPDLEAGRVLGSAGLVSGAVFSDIDGDGDADLLLACEWGPVRVFLNEGGRWREATAEWGLEEYRGWWNGVATGDFDGDGDQDLVASNWGGNSPYQAHRSQPLELVYGDLDGNGTVDLVEGYYDSETGRTLPWQSLDQLSRALPGLRERFPTYQEYGRATLAGVVGSLAVAGRVTANRLETALFMNEGNRFVVRALPVEAQLSPAFGISVADLDGDGAEDVFLSQNWFALDARTPRYDAGLGLWLRGDGGGGFAAVPGRESGIRVFGEQRGCAVSDFDRDGRVDLVVTQNGTETRLFRNLKSRPGLRIRLRGGPGNPRGVGVVLRLGDERGLGPAREIHAGSGYWSQDGAVAVMHYGRTPTRLQVRWPGEVPTMRVVPEGARELMVSREGGVEVVQ